ncbi:hypothetical protein [Roseateles sp. BYS96W]|uniref:Uncharacterized protein n=1 Tax=Pelomonas nitida TaxID=3299027 RepID=A0ABW7GD78_9BURK
MNQKFYVAYFAINPYGLDLPVKAMAAARTALENRLGGACQVLAAKAAFEEAGGLHAFWQGIYSPAITRWTAAAHHAMDAAYQVVQPHQASIEDIEHLNAACIYVIAATSYAYTPGEWLDAFTAHFGMSDHCETPHEAVVAGRRWLTVVPGACPIAAADQEIRRRSQPHRPLDPTHESHTQPSINRPRHTVHHRRAQPCF